MTTAEIEQACPRLLRIRLDASVERHRNSQRLLAWHVAHVVNLVSKRKVTPSELLGDEPERIDFDSKEDFVAHMRAAEESDG